MTLILILILRSLTVPLSSFLYLLPHRIQEELVENIGRISGTNTLSERFRVHILGSIPDLPIAFVEPDAPSGTPSPADAIVIVREFLRKHLKQTERGSIKLDTLGPSPFHADIYQTQPRRTRKDQEELDDDADSASGLRHNPDRR